MKLLATFLSISGLLALAGCAKPDLEAGPRHDVKVRVVIKVPFSTDYDWSFQAMDEYKGNRQQLAASSGRGGYHYESFEHNETNMAAGHVLTTTGSFSPASLRSGSLSSAAYLTMKILVDGTVKADTTINSLLPPTSSGNREIRLRVVL
ncbi:hypothetical protein [Hymenobacter bucti]|uniref:Proteinase inhibitor I42 chagasin domain-containing protein n=1 Tax=Hymenobacter bucti TaxID=1844114 RepID=A0ABW4QZJ2_9BACT